MNTRRTIRNRDDDLEMDDEYEEHRGWDEEREGVALSRHVTEAESQCWSKEATKRTRRTECQTQTGEIPPKKTEPEGTARSHTDTAVGARPKAPATRCRGTGPSGPRRGGHASALEHRTRDETRASHERKKLFDDDTIAEAITNQLLETAEQAPPGKTHEIIIALMEKEQLAASLQHMVLKWNELQASTPAGGPPCKPSTSDSQLWRPATETHVTAATTPPRSGRLSRPGTAT